MKARKKLTGYFRKRQAAILSLLEKPADKFSYANFHQLRVEIKKLKALSNLLDFCVKDFNGRKSFKPVKKFFDEAGHVRELQLEETFLKKEKKTSSLSEYLYELKTARLKHRKRFFSMIKEKQIEKLKKGFKEIELCISNINAKETNMYLEQKTGEISSVIKHEALKIQDAHLLRKQLKSFYYLAKVLNIYPGETELKRMARFQDLLGKWHDYRVMARHMKDVSAKPNLRANAKKQLEKISFRSEAEAEKLFENIQSKIDIELIPLLQK